MLQVFRSESVDFNYSTPPLAIKLSHKPFLRVHDSDWGAKMNEMNGHLISQCMCVEVSYESKQKIGQLWLNVLIELRVR